MAGQDNAVVCPSCGTSNPVDNSFCGNCGTKLDANREAGRLPEERRWATVMFVDVSGFTAMSEQMDPEDVRELARDCVSSFSAQTMRFGGTVLREMGDEVLAIFGAPIAHEDDAERAVRAALAIRDTAMLGPDGRALRVHVGVNTGEMITTMVDLGDHQDYTVHGDTVNTAARLRAAAESGNVVVGEETYRATQHVVRYQAIDSVEAKGKERPVLAWQALDVAPVPIARKARSTPMIGRDDELVLLTGIWTKVSHEARPHLVTVVGDPGIGKSRLVAEFERRIDGVTVVHGRCPPYGDVFSYWALSTALKEAAGIGAEDDDMEARAKLDRLVSRAVEEESWDTNQDTAQLVALLGGYQQADGARPVDQPMLYAAFRRFLEGYGRLQPAIIVLDDIHWADDALLDLLEYVAARMRDTPLLFLTQTRPELLERRPSWGRGVRAFTSLSLEPLGQDDASRLVSALSTEHGLAPDIAKQVGQGASGNPLFMEELVAMLAQRGGGAHIPSAIKALISARIDALPRAERTVLQRAAVFGKVFWEGGLRALGVPDPLADHLEELEYRDLVRSQTRSRFPGEREYLFKHDLIRDVAFEMLLRTDRRTLHGKIVEWIESVADGRTDEYLDLLAHHAVEAGQRDRAVQYLLRAAELGQGVAAPRKEAQLLSQALELVDDGSLREEILIRRGRARARAALWKEARADFEETLSLVPETDRERRAEILVELASANTWGFGGQDANGPATEALELAEEVGRGDLAAGAMTYLATTEAGQGNPIGSLSHFEHAAEQARASRRLLRGGTLQGSMMYSVVLYWAGRYSDAIDVGEDAVQEMGDRNESFARMLALPHLGLALAGKGRYAEAMEAFDRARQFGSEFEILAPLARSIAMSAGMHLELHDLAGHRDLAEEARELGRSRFPPTLAFTGADLLMNAARGGDPGRVEGSEREVAEEVAKATAWHRWLSTIRLYQARAELALARGELDRTLEWTASVIERSEATSRSKYAALGRWTRAAALREMGRTNEAIADLRHAVRLARELDDPALFVRVSGPLLEIDGDDDLFHEARARVDGIQAALSDERLRNQFLSMESVRQIERLRR